MAAGDGACVWSIATSAPEAMCSSARKSGNNAIPSPASATAVSATPLRLGSECSLHWLGTDKIAIWRPSLAPVRKPAYRPDMKSPAPFHHGDLKNALIAGALEAIAEGGAEAVQLRALAKDIGVAHPAVYRHFADRDALVRAALAQGYRNLVAHIPSGKRGASLDLAALGAAYAKFAFANPRLFLTMTGPRLATSERDPDLETAIESSFAPIIAAIEAGQAAGRFDQGKPRALAVYFWAALQGVLTQIIHGRIGVRRDLRDAYVSELIGRIALGLSKRPSAKADMSE